MACCSEDQRRYPISGSIPSSTHIAFLRHGSLAATIALTAALMIVLWGAAALAIIPALSAQFLVEKTYSEGWNAYHALRAAAGEVLYSGDPRHPVNYPFISFYLVGSLEPLFGNVLMIGRAVNLLSLAWLVGASGLVITRLGGRPSDAFFGALCVLAFQIIQAPGWIGADDPQMLAEACMMSGLLCYLGNRGSIRNLAGAVVFLGIGGFVKHNLIAIPVAISCDILWNSRRLFWIWAGLAGGMLAALTGLTYVIAGGDFLGEMLAPRIMTWQQMHYHTQKFAIHFKLPIAVALACLAGERGVLLRSYGLVSLVSAIIFAAGEGTSYNIFLDVTVFLGIIAGLALSRWRSWAEGLGAERSGTARTAAVFLLPLILAQPVIVRLPESTKQLLGLSNFLAGLESGERRFLTAAAKLGDHPGAALCESLILCFQAGKPMTIDPYNARQLILVGHLDERILLDAISRHDFAVVEMPTWIYAPGRSGEIAQFLYQPPRFTENTLRAIEQYYSPAWTSGGLVFYEPKAPGRNTLAERLDPGRAIASSGATKVVPDKPMPH
jgi:hypothetical protein